MLGFIACIVHGTSAHAAETTADFLKIPVNARAVSLGSGIVAIDDGVGSIAGNPAGLGKLPAKEASLLYAPYLGGMNLGFLAYGHPTPWGSFGLSYLTLRSGSLDGRDDVGNPAGSFSSESHAIGISYARGLFLAGDHSEALLNLGIHLKQVSSSIASYSASTYALDLGAQAPFHWGRFPVSVGAALRNMGPGMRFLDSTEALPFSIGAGASVQVLSALNIVAGITQYPQNNSTQFSVGTEYAVFHQVSFRGSYGVGNTQRASNGPVNISGGLGIGLGRYRVDYAIAPMGELGNTQRISLTFRFGAEQAAEHVASKAPKPIQEDKNISRMAEKRSPDEELVWIW